MEKPEMEMTIGKYRFEIFTRLNIVNIFNTRSGANVDCFTCYDLHDQKFFEKYCNEHHASFVQGWS